VKGVALLDGRLVPLEEATVPLASVQVVYGLAVFETLEAGPGLDPEPNLRRLAESARAIGVEPPPDAVLRAEIEAVRAAVGERAWVRINLAGDGTRQVYATPVEEARRHAPVRAGRAPHLESLLPGSVKHRSRAPWQAEVRRRGVDELLFVDGDGRFTEATSCAVVAVVGGVLFTAPWDGRILRSTTLERLLAGYDGPVVRQGADAAGPWDALYVVSTRRVISPVVELDGASCPGWDPVGERLRPRR
jgi:branched-subunit amino acid aminotransferase/4-amino-4-deoxychorismate lyase